MSVDICLDDPLHFIFRDILTFVTKRLSAKLSAIRSIDNLDFAIRNAHGTDTALTEKCEEARKKFKTAMDDDLNTPDALAAIFEFVKDINTMSDAADKATLEKAAATFDELTGVLGLMYNRKAEEAPDEVKQLVEERAAAKKTKDFARADALRAKITELGWNVMDTAKGPQLTKL